MSLASGIGSWPGEQLAPLLRWLLERPHTLPYLPELPQRGPEAGLVGRTAGMITHLGFDLHPTGWRLSPSISRAQRVARSLLQQDLDSLEESTQGWQGPFKVSLAGPWTLVAQLEKPRGEGVLADHGAVREIIQAHQLAVAEFVAQMRRRVPGMQVVLQIDEPSLPQVLAGRVATASGWATHRSIDRVVATEALEDLVAHSDAAEVVIHCCDPQAPVGLLCGVAPAVSVPVAQVSAAGLEAIGHHLDNAGVLYAGVIDPLNPHANAERQAVTTMQRIAAILGFSPAAIQTQIVLTPICGFASVEEETARSLTGQLAHAAVALSELED